MSGAVRTPQKLADISEFCPKLKPVAILNSQPPEPVSGFSRAMFTGFST